MKLSYQDKPIRAKKDSRPYTAGGRLWTKVSVIIDEAEYEGLVSTHWVYFEYKDQWYKLNTRLYGVDIRNPVLYTREASQQSLDEKRERRQARRRERRARDRALREAQESAEREGLL
jgi:hypothetical protein